MPDDKRASAPSESRAAASTFCDLVTQVKALQSTSTNARAAWTDHCESTANGTKDPARHSAQSLEAFIRHVGKGLSHRSDEEPSPTHQTRRHSSTCPTFPCPKCNNNVPLGTKQCPNCNRRLTNPIPGASREDDLTRMGSIPLLVRMTSSHR